MPSPVLGSLPADEDRERSGIKLHSRHFTFAESEQTALQGPTKAVASNTSLTQRSITLHDPRPSDNPSTSSRRSRACKDTRKSEHDCETYMDTSIEHRTRDPEKIGTAYFNRAKARERFKGKKNVQEPGRADDAERDDSHFARTSSASRVQSMKSEVEGKCQKREQAPWSISELDGRRGWSVKGGNGERPEILDGDAEVPSSPETAAADRTACSQEKLDLFPGAT